MRDFLDNYKNNELPINIEEVIHSLWINIEYFNFDKINGFISWKNIVINKTLNLSEKRFTLAHELWHYIDWEIWASTGIFACKEDKEKRADSFAMDLLCPTKQVTELWEEHENIPTLAQFLVVPERLIEKKLKLIYN